MFYRFTFYLKTELDSPHVLAVYGKPYPGSHMSSQSINSTWEDTWTMLYYNLQILNSLIYKNKYFPRISKTV